MSAALEVAIVGGGFAGLCAALQLLRARPATRVAVIDARPLPDACERRGVGESTSELAAWYLAGRLDLREHLEHEQIVKFGLRFWLREPGRGTAIDERIEWGPMGLPAKVLTAGGRVPEIPLEPHAYQLHRGRLEHALALRVAGAGGELLGRHRLLACHAHPQGHALELEGPGGVTRSLTCRWLIDASGDGAPSRARLGESLAAERVLDHRLAAAWWWVEGEPLDPGGWASDPAIVSRGLPQHRWRSTHHLVGEGYWAWLIPLSDGSTSVGLVVDEDTLPDAPRELPSHALPFALRDRLSRLEPELGERLSARASSPVLGGRPRSRARMHPLRPGVLVSGAALAFLDPLYSSGHDLSALIHELALPRIVDDLEGRPIDAWIDPIERSFAHVIDHFSHLYVDNAVVLADPVMASLAIGWDQLVYFGWLAALGLSGKLGDPAIARANLALADRVHRLNVRVHALLRRWARSRRSGVRREPKQRFVDQGALELVMGRFFPLDRFARGELGSDDLLAHLHATIDRLELVALGLLERSCIDRGVAFPREPLDPYAIGFDPSRWAAEGLFGRRRARRLDADTQRELAMLALDLE